MLISEAILWLQEALTKHGDVPLQWKITDLEGNVMSVELTPSIQMSTGEEVIV